MKKISDEFGLSESDIRGLCEVLSRYPEVEKAILYGSRAMGNYRLASDIDVTLTGDNLSLSTLLSIENDVDDLLLPYKTDLSIFSKINNPQLINHIEKHGIVFYSRAT